MYGTTLLREVLDHNMDGAISSDDFRSALPVISIYNED